MSRWFTESTRFLTGRLLAMLLVLIGVGTITFAVTRMLGNPVYLLVGQQADKEIIDNMIHQMGLDRPLPEQYAHYMLAVAQGDLGISRVTQRPVWTEIRLRLPATMELVLAAMFLIIFMAIPLGIAAAVREGGWVDRSSQFVAQIGISIPSFWMGLILIYVFFFRLQWFPAPLGRISPGVLPPTDRTGFLLLDCLMEGNLPALWSALSHLVLPAITLALVSAPSTFQITRTSLIQALRSEYIRTARAYGLPARSIYARYAMKNIVVPVVTMLAMTFGFLMSSTVLVETVFSWPGIGLFAVNSMHNLDYEPIIGVVFLSAVFYALAYFVADLVTFAVDPRIRSR
jgi:ABC-type dipeptide/oligopeptide/nickel transport system permease component